MKKYLELIGAIAGTLATIGFFWAMIWFLCILSDSCYYANFPGAL
tara:strand:- start:249 stop:383 length:135 start_codon:yes stop_codon:yes gene_type:complete